jgi:hypothetical protein
MPSDATDKAMRQGWRELGFFYDCDEKSKVWRLTGSREGLRRFRDVLHLYATDPRNAIVPEHQHYGPYMFLVIQTSLNAGFDHQSIRGSVTDLAGLANLVEARLVDAHPGSVLRIEDEFAAGTPYALILDVREDSFDPATADPLLPPEDDAASGT